MRELDFKSDNPGSSQPGASCVTSSKSKLFFSFLWYEMIALATNQIITLLSSAYSGPDTPLGALPCSQAQSRAGATGARQGWRRVRGRDVRAAWGWTPHPRLSLFPGTSALRSQVPSQHSSHQPCSEHAVYSPSRNGSCTPGYDKTTSRLSFLT